MTPHDSERHGPHRVVGKGFYSRVHALVRTVPRGCVTTYGDLAARLGHSGVARHVGYALAECPPDVPWHRVVNARGAVSKRADGAPSARQVAALRREGIVVSAAGVVRDFARLRYTP